MNFLYPQFLFGLLALSIPIVIHLFNFRKTRKVYYSSTEFLKNVKEASTSKLRIKHWLILASRLLFISFLVFAFAQPFIPAQQQRSSDPDVYIYLDNSASMTNQIGTDYTAMDAGVSFIDQLPRLFPAGTRYKLLTNDYASFSNFFQTREELSDLTTELSVGGNHRTFSDVWSRMHSSIEAPEKQNDIFWISDFQRSTIGNLDGIDIDSSYNVNFFPLEAESYANLFVDSVYLNNPFFFGQDKVSLTVTIRNAGQDDKESVPIKVFLNELQIANATFSIEANSSHEMVFDLGFELASVNEGRISIEDYPITFDNDFYFTIDRGKKVNVMEVRASDTPTIISSVYGNNDLFEFRSFRYTNVDYNFIETADIVILNALVEIDPAFSVMLNTFTEQGGTVVIIPSARPDLDSYQQLVSFRTLTLSDSLVASNLASPDVANPFYENVFEETNNRMVMPHATPVLRWGGDRVALLSFANGTPYLSRFQQEGTTYLFSGPFRDDLTGFHLHALFVPVMYKMALYSRQDLTQLFYTVDDPTIITRIDSMNQNSIVKMTFNDQEFIPVQRLVSGNMRLELPSDIVQPGFYTISVDGRKISTVAFNIDNEESFLKQLTAEELATAFSFPNVAVFEANSEQDFSLAVRKQYEGTPLWKFAIILALLFLMAEVLLIRFLK